MKSLNNSTIQEQLYLLALQQDLYVQKGGLRYQCFVLWGEEEKQQNKDNKSMILWLVAEKLKLILN